MPTTKTDEIMEYTGERMVPEKAEPEVFWEHIYRYRFAARYARGRRVLDIACGEGYGTAGLRKAGARSVTGVDLSQEACEHARRKYQIDARVGSAEDIPLPSGSFDLVVSFETIEHVPNPERFLDECVRVLAPGGMAIISTPNEPVYNHNKEAHNPFHCSELTEDEFTAMLARHFTRFSLHTQKPMQAAWWSSRAFVATASPWHQVKGYWRIRNLLAASQCPHIACEGAEEERFRGDAISMMTAPDSRLEFLANPYLVRRRSPSSREKAMYLIAVAHL